MKGINFKNILAISILLSLTSQLLADFTPKKSPQNQEAWITVFVHGIISMAPLLSLKTMRQVKNEQIENTVYKEYVTNIRRNRIVCKNQAMQELGLKKIDTMRTDTTDGCPALAKLFDMQYSWINPSIKNHYYTFGWSGIMTTQARYKDAKIFYTALNEEIKKFHDEGVYPKTRLIGFSHGGSVCLSLATVKKQEKIANLFNVDELILLGMPVIQNSYASLDEPFFKKIHHFYSTEDKVQILDFSQPGKLFSSRKFQTSRHAALPENLLQVRLDIFRHTSFPCCWAKSKGAKVQSKTAFPRHSRSIRKSSPGHCEWWFFGWTNKYYRNNFAIAPLPVAALLPSITRSLEQSTVKPEKNKKFGNQIKIEVRPFSELITIRTKSQKEQLSFLSDKKLCLLQETTMQLPFKKTTNKMYSQKVEKAIQEAKEIIAQHIAKNPPAKKHRKHKRI